MDNQLVRYSDKFNTMLYSLLQKEGGMLPMLGMQETQSDAKQSFDRIQPQKMTKRGARFAKTELNEAKYNRRWVKCDPYYTAVGIDSIDNIRAATGDPNHKITQELLKAAQRARDHICIQAMLGSAITGKDGTDLTKLPDAQKVSIQLGNRGVIPANGAKDTGLHYSKLLNARKLLKNKHAIKKGASAYFLTTDTQLDHLLYSTKTTSADYNAVKTLVNGDIDTFANFQFLPCNDNDETDDVFLPLNDAGTVRKNIAFTGDAFVYSTQKGVMVKVSERPDLQDAVQISIAFDEGAVRWEEGRVVEVPCLETWEVPDNF